MGQNNIWMRFLQLGTIFSILFLFSACKKEYFRVGHFYFVNETSHKITYSSLFEEYNILPYSTVLIKQNQDGTRSVNLADYFSPFLMRSKDPITIKFDNNRCLLNGTSNDVHSVLDMKSFVSEKVDQFTYKFTYTFTEADYNRAVNCP